MDGHKWTLTLPSLRDGPLPLPHYGRGVRRLSLQRYPSPPGEGERLGEGVGCGTRHISGLA